MIKNWKSFFIGGSEGIFTLRSTNSGIDKNKLLESEEKNIPYITRSNFNNGIDMFVGKEQKSNYDIDPANVITIGLDSQTVFYQPHKFYTGQNIQVLYNKHLNKYSALFIIRLLKVQMQKFNWGGNGATLGRLMRTKIMLPVNSNGEPDYDYMENYVKDDIDKKIKVYKAYCKNQSKDLGEYKVIPDISKVKWESFELQTIAKIDSGIDIYDAERVDGNLPYITAGIQDNGIGYFVGNTNKTLEQDAISVSRNGANVGCSFYHHYKALYSNDCRKVKLNDYSANKFVSLFVTNQIMIQRKNYNYSRKMGTGRLKRQRIMLPSKNGKPDYDYMEQYIKNLMIKKYKTYLEYKK